MQSDQPPVVGFHSFATSRPIHKQQSCSLSLALSDLVSTRIPLQQRADDSELSRGATATGDCFWLNINERQKCILLFCNGIEMKTQHVRMSATSISFSRYSLLATTSFSLILFFIIFNTWTASRCVQQICRSDEIGTQRNVSILERLLIMRTKYM